MDAIWRAAAFAGFRALFPDMDGATLFCPLPPRSRDSRDPTNYPFGGRPANDKSLFCMTHTGNVQVWKRGSVAGEGGYVQVHTHDAHGERPGVEERQRGWRGGGMCRSTPILDAHLSSAAFRYPRDVHRCGRGRGGYHSGEQKDPSPNTPHF